MKKDYYIHNPTPVLFHTGIIGYLDYSEEALKEVADYRQQWAELLMQDFQRITHITDENGLIIGSRTWKRDRWGCIGHTW